MRLLAELDRPARADAVLHARRLLESQGLSVRQIVSVDVDSVLYVSRAGGARTAWLQVSPSGLIVRDEPGFAAEPPRFL